MLQDCFMTLREQRLVCPVNSKIVKEYKQNIGKIKLYKRLILAVANKSSKMHMTQYLNEPHIKEFLRHKKLILVLKYNKILSVY